MGEVPLVATRLVSRRTARRRGPRTSSRWPAPAPDPCWPPRELHDHRRPPSAV